MVQNKIWIEIDIKVNIEKYILKIRIEIKKLTWCKQKGDFCPIWLIDKYWRKSYDR